MLVIVSIIIHAYHHTAIVFMCSHGARVRTIRVDDNDGRLAARCRAIKILRRLALLGRPAPELLMHAVKLVGSCLRAIWLRSDIQVLRVNRLLVVLLVVMGVDRGLLWGHHLVGQADGVE